MRAPSSTVFVLRVPHPFAFSAKGWAARIVIFNRKELNDAGRMFLLSPFSLFV